MFERRINRVQKDLKTGDALLIQSSPPKLRNGDVHFPHHPNRYLYYLTGFTEASAWLLITKKTVILFSQENSPKQRLWDGELMAENSEEQLPIDQWQPLRSFEEQLNAIKTLEHIYFIGENYPATLPMSRGEALIDQYRIYKDEEEIKSLRKSASIASHAHNALIQQAKHHDNEMALAGLFIYETMRRGAPTLAYPPIIASGKNACILHYTANNAPLKKHGLILADCGCEYRQYCSDITRTFPQNGRFSNAEQAIYEAVLDTQTQIINSIKPGIRLKALHEQACQLICQHLIDLNLLTGPLDSNLENKTYLTYFPHGIGHTLGLDVHDCPLVDDTLKPGMVITVEPGIYVTTEGRYQDIGVRIEDDILITESGYENLSEEAYKTISDLTHLMAS